MHQLQQNQMQRGEQSHQPQTGQFGGQPEMGQRQTHLFPTQHYLSRETRAPIVELLNQCLADTTDLMTQAKSAHWNVKGIEFYQLHQLFDELAAVFEEHADLLAERATALGGQAEGTVRAAAVSSRIPELPPSVVDGPQLVQQLANRLAVHDANLYEAINRATEYGDLDTADLLNELSIEVSKQLYFLESHLQTQPVATVQQVQGGQQLPPQQSGSQQFGTR